jgi:hypothetical protein
MQIVAKLLTLLCARVSVVEPTPPLLRLVSHSSRNHVEGHGISKVFGKIRICSCSRTSCRLRL